MRSGATSSGSSTPGRRTAHNRNVRRIAALLVLTALAAPATLAAPAAQASDRTLRADVKRLVAATKHVDVQSADSLVRFRETARSVRDGVIADRASSPRGKRGQNYALRAAGAYVRWSDALIVVLESLAPGGSANDTARAKDQVRRFGGQAQQCLAEARRLLRA